MTLTPQFRIDRDLCVGHGRCYGLAPESFEADDMGHGVVRDQQAGTPTRTPEVIANACPEGAIELIAEANSAEKGSQP